MDIISVYNDYLDRTGSEQNGITTIPKFNRYSKLGELRLLDYLTGDVEGMKPPEPYNVQKLRDWLTFLTEKDLKQVQSGESAKPDNYYRFESLVIIGSYWDDTCGKAVFVSKGDTPIDLLDSDQFNMRTRTHIEALKPSALKPIAKMIGNNFEYMPKDLGSVKLEYIRYPIYGELKTKVDPVYNNVVPDPATSINYEWPEFGRNILLYFITQQFPIATREKALVEQNEVVGKSSRG